MIRSRGTWVALFAASAALALYSQTLAWNPDEGVHLMTAKLLLAGRLPYRDFFYQHPPGYALLAAGWMRIFGESWRSAHALSACLAAACLYLTARLAFRVADPARRTTATVVAIAFVSLQLEVVQFATIAQPYALCLLLGVAAALLLSETATSHRAAGFAAGLCAGMAVSASLLMTAPLAAEIGWLCRHGRYRRLPPFLIGVVVGLMPLAAVAAAAPHAALFDMVQFHLRYRGVPGQPGVAGVDRAVLLDQARVVAAGARSIQALLVAVLAAIGWRTAVRNAPAAASLCAAIAVVTGVALLVPHPTFARYFVLIVPFASVLAAAGVCALAARVSAIAARIFVTAALVAFVAGLGRSIYQARAFVYPYWSEAQEVMERADAITPPGGPMYVDGENLYFLSRWLPPAGLENTYGANNGIPPAIAAPMHIVSQSEIDAWLASGRFATAVLFEGDDRVDRLRLRQMYARSDAYGRHHDRFLVLADRR